MNKNLVISLLGIVVITVVVIYGSGLFFDESSSVCEVDLGSGKEIAFEEIKAQKDEMIMALATEGKYRCCLEKPCASCLTLDPWHGEGVECSCLDDLVNGKYPCGECAGGILAGRGNKYLTEYFAPSIADKMGEEHLEVIEKIISEKYKDA